MGDYARIIVDAFVARRGHGSAVSSLDQALVLKWERLGVPLGVVLDAVDECFRKRREPPTSLQECARGVKSAFERWTLDAPAESAPCADPAALEPRRHDRAAPSRDEGEGVRAADWLRAHAEAARTDRGKAVMSRLAEEVVRHFGAGIVLDAIPDGSLERAFFALAWSALTDEERARCDSIAQRSVSEAISPRLAAAALERARIEVLSTFLGVGLRLPNR